MKILITGATGFVGSHLHHLLSDQHEVFALVRNPDKAKECGVIGNIISGDMSHRSISKWIEQLPEDLDAVIHCASILHSFKEDDYYKVNSKGTRSLIGLLAEKYKKLKFILISSQAAAGPSKERSVKESDPPLPVSHYGRSKLRAENFLKDLSPKTWSCTIIRPPMVIGPRDPGMLEVFKMINQNYMLVPGIFGLQKKYSFIAVYDLIKAIELLLKKDLDGTQCFHLAYPEPISYSTLIKTIQSNLDKNFCFKIFLPHFLLFIVAYLLKAMSLIKKPSLPLGPDKYRELSPSSWVLDSTKSVNILNMDYHYDLDRSCKSAIESYRELSWL